MSHETESEHIQKVMRLIADLRNHGIVPNAAAPRLFRFLWYMGLIIPPPFFLRFYQLAMITIPTFAIVFGVGGWVLFSWPFGVSIGDHLRTTAWAAGTMGVAMAALIRRQSLRLQLGSWEDYGKPTR